jgi:ATP-binding cassette subfamily B (MDR/TAP) protein 1
MTAGDVITAFWSCLIAAKSFEDILPQWIVIGKGKAAAGALQSISKEDDNHEICRPDASGLVPRFCAGDVKIHGVRTP